MLLHFPVIPYLFSAVWNAVNLFATFFSELLLLPCSSGCRQGDSLGEWPHCTAGEKSTPVGNLRLAWDSKEKQIHRRSSLQWSGKNRLRRPSFCLQWSWCSGWWRQCGHMRRRPGVKFQKHAQWWRTPGLKSCWRYQSKRERIEMAAHSWSEAWHVPHRSPSSKSWGC